jgi:hypothetical protein
MPKKQRRVHAAFAAQGVSTSTGDKEKKLGGWEEWVAAGADLGRDGNEEIARAASCGAHWHASRIARRRGELRTHQRHFPFSVMEPPHRGHGQRSGHGRGELLDAGGGEGCHRLRLEHDFMQVLGMHELILIQLFPGG